MGRADPGVKFLLTLAHHRIQTVRESVRLIPRASRRRCTSPSLFLCSIDRSLFVAQRVVNDILRMTLGVGSYRDDKRRGISSELGHRRQAWLATLGPRFRTACGHTRQTIQRYPSALCLL